MSRKQSVDRPLPYSIDAEQAALGSFLLDYGTIDKAMAFLRPADFYQETHCWLYEAMVSLRRRNEPVDTLTLTEELERAGHLDDVGGPAAITALCLRVPTAIHWEHYARIVERNSRLRALVAAAEQIAKLAFTASDESVGEIYDKAESLVYAARGHLSRSDPRHVGDVLSEIELELEALRQAGAAPGMPSSLADLNALMGGYHRGEQTVLVARPAVGKSSLATQEAWHLASLGYAVLVVSLEMSGKSVGRRLIARAGRIPLRHLRDGLGAKATGAEWDELQTSVAETVGRLGELPLYIDDTPALGAQEIRAKAKGLRAHLGRLDFIVVDYLGLVHLDRRDSRTREDVLVGEAARLMRETARELDCHCLLLHQFNREAARGRPALHHIAESGWIERHADVVLAIHDPHMAGEQGAVKGIKEILQLKNRNGDTGYIEARFDGPTQAWYDIAPDYVAAQEPPAHAWGAATVARDPF